MPMMQAIALKQDDKVRKIVTRIELTKKIGNRSGWA
ncbi:hypothetical protein GLO73106DRAFT_00039290 [Gloeocapsa sp. PCC 73106]|nr:hypothetical protein GLO73106DRAFT_00039290 [Gloeocapsa sp. PCC 73106]